MQLMNRGADPKKTNVKGWNIVDSESGLIQTRRAALARWRAGWQCAVFDELFEERPQHGDHAWKDLRPLIQKFVFSDL